MFLDLAKAFGIVNNDILQHKAEILGRRGKTSYLEAKQQRKKY